MKLNICIIAFIFCSCSVFGQSLHTKPDSVKIPAVHWHCYDSIIYKEPDPIDIHYGVDGNSFSREGVKELGTWNFPYIWHTNSTGWLTRNKK